MRTGKASFIGRIAALAVGAEPLASQLVLQIQFFVRRIVTVGIALAILYLIIGFSRGLGIADVFDVTVGTLVTFLPQGLPATITLLLTIAVKKMADRQVLAKNVHAVETLGTITCLATDKTGTLTMNMMRVRAFSTLKPQGPNDANQPSTSAASAVENRTKEAVFMLDEDKELPEAVQNSGVLKWLVTCGRLCHHSRLEGGLSSSPPHDKQEKAQKTETTTPDSGGTSQALPPSASPTTETETDVENGGADDSVQFWADRIIHGDATEVGILRWAGPLLKEHSAIPEALKWKRIGELPFTSDTKYHVTVYASPPSVVDAGEKLLLLVKGAPERVCDFCTRQLILSRDDERAVPLNQEAFERSYKNLAGHGYRSLGMAYKRLSGNELSIQADGKISEEDIKAYLDKIKRSQNNDDDPDDEKQGIRGCTWIGMIALYDPPKEGVKEAIEKCQDAGIRVIMVTGDHPLTAASIARQVGILKSKLRTNHSKHRITSTVSPGNPNPNSNTSVAPNPNAFIAEGDQPEVNPVALEEGNTATTNIDLNEDEEERDDELVVTGDQLDKIPEAAWSNCILRAPYLVIARALPRHKLDLVKRLQAIGHIVAVTGDGVNDAPALRIAHLGISMNKTASDLSKDVASLVILDDRFATIVEGIHQGRLIFENLKKSVQYLLSHIQAVALGLFVFVVVAGPLTISPLLVMVIDLLTDVPPAVAFAFEPPELDLMLQAPRIRLPPMPAKDQSICCEMLLNAPPPTAPATSDPETPAADQQTANLLEHQDQTAQPDQTTQTNLTIVPATGISQSPRIATTPGIGGNANLVADGQKKDKKRFMQYVTWPLGIIYRIYHDPVRGESLVDWPVIRAAFGESGLFIAAGAFGAWLLGLVFARVPLGHVWNTGRIYYMKNSPPLALTNGTFATGPEQVTIEQRLTTGFFMAIMICQYHNVFMTKHRYRPPLGWDLFVNKWTYWAIIVSAGIMACVAFVPPFQAVFNTAYIYGVQVAPPFVAGFLLCTYWMVRRSITWRRIQSKYRRPPLQIDTKAAGPVATSTTTKTSLVAVHPEAQRAALRERRDSVHADHLFTRHWWHTHFTKANSKEAKDQQRPDQTHGDYEERARRNSIHVAVE